MQRSLMHAPQSHSRHASSWSGISGGQHTSCHHMSTKASLQQDTGAWGSSTNRMSGLHDASLRASDCSCCRRRSNFCCEQNFFKACRFCHDGSHHICSSHNTNADCVSCAFSAASMKAYESTTVHITLHSRLGRCLNRGTPPPNLQTQGSSTPTLAAWGSIAFITTAPPQSFEHRPVSPKSGIGAVPRNWQKEYFPHSALRRGWRSLPTSRPGPPRSHAAVRWPWTARSHISVSASKEGRI